MNLGLGLSLTMPVVGGAAIGDPATLPATYGTDGSTAAGATDITVTADLLLADWTPAAVQCIAGQYETGNRSWYLELRPSGYLGFVYSTDGLGRTNVNASGPISVTDGERAQLMMQRVAGTGAITFSQRPTSEDPWAQIGSVRTGPTGPLVASTADFTAGGSASGDALGAGELHRVTIDTTTAAAVDCYPGRDNPGGAVSWSSGTGESWSTLQ